MLLRLKDNHYPNPDFGQGWELATGMGPKGQINQEGAGANLEGLCSSHMIKSHVHLGCLLYVAAPICK